VTSTQYGGHQRPTNALILGIASSRYGPSDLEDGELALYCLADGTLVKLTRVGKISIDAAAGQDVVVNGGTARVAREGDPVNGGSVTAVAGATPVTFIYAPAGGLPGSPSTTLVLSGGKITGGADRFKG
jgi:hypothetical protein